MSRLSKHVLHQMNCIAANRNCHHEDIKSLQNCTLYVTDKSSRIYYMLDDTNMFYMYDTNRPLSPN